MTSNSIALVAAAGWQAALLPAVARLASSQPPTSPGIPGSYEPFVSSAGPSPTTAPTGSPTPKPTDPPTSTAVPTGSPISAPTKAPTPAPTAAPTLPSEPTSLPSSPEPPALAQVGHTGLGRGGNGALAVGGKCAYVGTSNGANTVAIADISDPTHPQPAGTLTYAPGQAPLELRVTSDGTRLVVMTVRSYGGWDANGLHVYDLRDCLRPVKLGSYSFQLAVPHEFFLWRDLARPGRLLALVAMFESRTGLNVIDLSDPRRPILLAAWNGFAPSELVHSLSLSADGTRAYIADWDGGLLIADTGELAEARPNPQLHLLGRFAYPGARAHSTVPVPGRPLVILADEVYGCPFGWLRVVSVVDERHPVQVGEFRIAENTACRGVLYSAHNPLVLPDGIFASWYQGGIQVVDLRDSFHPRPLAQFRAGGEQFWSSPIVADGLLYAVSVEGGLYILSYHGPLAGELLGAPLLQANAN